MSRTFDMTDFPPAASLFLMQRIQVKRSRADKFDGAWQFWVGVDQCWDVDVQSDPTVIFVSDGIAAAATATFKVSETDLAAMLAGDLEPVYAWQHHRLTIIGNHGPALAMTVHVMHAVRRLDGSDIKRTGL